MLLNKDSKESKKDLENKESKEFELKESKVIKDSIINKRLSDIKANTVENIKLSPAIFTEENYTNHFPDDNNNNILDEDFNDLKELRDNLKTPDKVHVRDIKDLKELKEHHSLNKEHNSNKKENILNRDNSNSNQKFIIDTTPKKIYITERATTKKRRVITNNNLNVINEDFITKLHKNYGNTDSDKSYLDKKLIRPESKMIIKYERVNSGKTKSRSFKDYKDNKETTKKKVVIILPVIKNQNLDEVSETLSKEFNIHIPPPVDKHNNKYKDNTINDKLPNIFNKIKLDKHETQTEGNLDAGYTGDMKPLFDLYAPEYKPSRAINKYKNEKLNNYLVKLEEMRAL